MQRKVELYLHWIKQAHYFHPIITTNLNLWLSGQKTTVLHKSYYFPYIILLQYLWQLDCNPRRQYKPSLHYLG